MSSRCETVEYPLVRGELEWRHPRHPSSAGTARRLLRYFLLVTETADRYGEGAELVLSELVANAVRHARVPAGREVWTRFEVGPDGLRIEVSDADGEHFPCPHAAGPLAESGRGLALVAALADAWGCDPRPCGIGKTTWAFLAR